MKSETIWRLHDWIWVQSIRDRCQDPPPSGIGGLWWCWRSPLRERLTRSIRLNGHRPVIWDLSRPWSPRHSHAQIWQRSGSDPEISRFLGSLVAASRFPPPFLRPSSRNLPNHWLAALAQRATVVVYEALFHFTRRPKFRTHDKGPPSQSNSRSDSDISEKETADHSPG